MSKENHHEIDWEVIRKSITGEISDAEQAELQDWLKGNAFRRRFVEQARHYYTREDFPLPDEKQVNIAWQKFQNHLRQKRLRRMYTWAVRFAAVVVIALGVVWVWKWEIRDNDSSTLPAIWPAHYQASLVLSDGSVVGLNGEKEKRVVKDREVEISLQGKGVVYTSGEQKADTIRNTIIVPQGGEYHLVLGDGTQVWLNAQTRLTYPAAFGKAERRVKLEGEAYFKVKPNGKRFVVETAGVEVEVLGTSFNVNAYPDEHSVVTTLIEGKVKVATGRETCVLHPGEQARKGQGQENIEVQQVNPAHYIQWREGYFSFRDNTLEDIMRVLARWYDMEYEFESPELGKVCFFGMLSRYQNMSDLLKEFEKTGKVKFRCEGHQVRVYAE